MEREKINTQREQKEHWQTPLLLCNDTRAREREGDMYGGRVERGRGREGGRERERGREGGGERGQGKLCVYVSNACWSDTRVLPFNV